MIDDIFLKLEEAVMNYDSAIVEELASKAIEQGYNPLDCVSALTRGIRKVGEGYKKGELFLPSLIGASNAMQAAMPFLNKEIKKTGEKINTLGKVVIGTVFGDVHSIGKNMVMTLLLAEGFEVIDLGVNVKAEYFVEAVKEHDANILALSALLSTTMIEQKNIVKLLIKGNTRDKVKVMIGGAPVTQEYADLIGADGYDATAVGATKLAKHLMFKKY